MIEILENISDWVKKVEKIHSGSVPSLEGECYTPPVSQMRVNHPSKLSAPPNLPIFLGQELVPSTEGSIDQWLFQEEGALATRTEEAVRSVVIESIRGAARALLRVHRLWRKNEYHIEAYKRMVWTRTFQSKTPERVFLDGTKKDRKYQSVCWKSGTAI